jgi:hypothetical protein
LVGCFFRPVIHFTHRSIFITPVTGPLRPLPERKPGHPDKLFQYCSTDINAMVQRQIRVRVPDPFGYPSLLIPLIPPLNTPFPQFDGERDLRTPQDFSGGGTGISRIDDMGDDDDDGDADDSPTVPYARQDSLKGKMIPESSQAVGETLEGSEVRSMLVSSPNPHSSSQGELPFTPSPPSIHTRIGTNSSCICRPSYSTPRLQQPRRQLVLIIHRAISESTKACQGG